MARPKAFKRESTKSLKAASIKVHAKTDSVLIKDAAIYEKATIESLRAFQHKDSEGNIIGKLSLFLRSPNRPILIRISQLSLILQIPHGQDGSALWTQSDHSTKTSKLDTSVVL